MSTSAYEQGYEEGYEALIKEAAKVPDFIKRRAARRAAQWGGASKVKSQAAAIGKADIASKAAKDPELRKGLKAQKLIKKTIPGAAVLGTAGYVGGGKAEDAYKKRKYKNALKGYQTSEKALSRLSVRPTYSS